jgi:hypothetical protein
MVFTWRRTYHQYRELSNAINALANVIARPIAVSNVGPNHRYYKVAAQAAARPAGSIWVQAVSPSSYSCIAPLKAVTV